MREISIPLLIVFRDTDKKKFDGIVTYSSKQLRWGVLQTCKNSTYDFYINLVKRMITTNDLDDMLEISPQSKLLTINNKVDVVMSIAHICTHLINIHFLLLD